MSSRQIVLKAWEITKQYPGTRALDGVSLELYSGEVRALIGENGAGKSTLVKILGGIEQPTSGLLVLDGREIRMRSVRDANANGIGIIHQELNLCPNLTVAENIFLARELTSALGVLKPSRQVQRSQELLRQLEQPIDADALVGFLPLGQQQIVEIAKALARDVRILMMDEPTSALSASEISVLFRIIRDLKARGVAIIYISHRLEELREISDKVSVLRDGKMVAEAPASDVSTRWIVEQMSGRADVVAEMHNEALAGSELLRIDSCSLTTRSGRTVLDDVSLRLCSGEVLGIYGLMGSGRTELLEYLMGLRPDATGRVWLDGESIGHLRTEKRISAGVVMVPEDRQTAGLVPTFSIRENITLSSLGKLAPRIWLSPAKERAKASQKAEDLRIRTSGLHNNIASLSGGNQQKVVLAKCLLTAPRVLLLDEPTRGVDVGAKREIYAIVRRLAGSGMGIIFVSSELEEIRTVADRVIVLSRGRIAGEFAGTEANSAALAIAASSRLEMSTLRAN